MKHQIFRGFCSGTHAGRWPRRSAQFATGQDDQDRRADPDNSGLYSDSRRRRVQPVAAPDGDSRISGMAAKGWKIDLISADHQNQARTSPTNICAAMDSIVEKVDNLHGTC